MSSKKQTAVEWLEFQINARGPKENNQPKWLKELYEQAKAMEKKQNEHYIRFGYMAGFNRGLDNNPNHLEEYIEYIKTFDL